jgi:hypothetical protein
MVAVNLNLILRPHRLWRVSARPGSLVDVTPGSVLEATIGASNLIPARPDDERWPAKSSGPRLTGHSASQ